MTSWQMNITGLIPGAAMCAKQGKDVKEGKAGGGKSKCQPLFYKRKGTDGNYLKIK